MKKTLRFIGGPADGKTYEVDANVKTVRVPGNPREPGFVRQAHGLGEYTYRRQRLESGEEVLRAYPGDVSAGYERRWYHGRRRDGSQNGRP